MNWVRAIRNRVLPRVGTLGRLVLPNRVGVAPMMHINATSEGLATDQMASDYTSFAQGSFGLIITEGLYTDEQHSPGYIYQPSIVNDVHEQAWKRVVGAVQQAASSNVKLVSGDGILDGIGNRFKNYFNEINV